MVKSSAQNSNIRSKKHSFGQKNLVKILPAQTMHYRKENPSKSPYIRIVRSPQIWVSFNDPWAPDISNIPQFLQANRSLFPISQCIPDPTAALPDADNASSSPGTTITVRSKHEELGNDFFLKWRVEVIEHSYWNPWKFLEDAMKFCECCRLDVLQN